MKPTDNADGVIRKRKRSSGNPSKNGGQPEQGLKAFAKKGYEHKTGQRPALLRDGMVDKLCEALLGGNTIKNSCALASIDETTYHRYIAEGRHAEEGSPLEKFCTRVRAAIAEAEQRAVLLIQIAAKKNWQAAAWFLERRSPKEWGRTDRMRLGSDEESPLVVGSVDLTEKTVTDRGAMAALKAVLARRPDLQP